MEASVESEVQALLTPDSARFEALVAGLMDPDNARREMAERVLTVLKKHPDLCMQYLVSTLRRSQSRENRGLCAIILRKSLASEEPGLWSRMSEAVQMTVKNELLAGLREEQEREVSRKMCDAVSELSVLLDDKWQELVPTMFHFLQSGVPNLKESALSVFAHMGNKKQMGGLTPYLSALETALKSCLKDDVIAVRRASFTAVCSVVQGAEKPSVQRQVFQALVPHMLGCLAEFLNAREDEATHEALGNIIEVVEEVPGCLGKELPQLAFAMIQVARNETLEEGVRSLAAELLLILCESRDQAVRRLPNFVSQLFEALMTFLLEAKDVPEWHVASEVVDEDAGHDELFEVGQECLDRVAMALGGKAIVPVAGQILNHWIQDQDWKKRHATLICLAQIAEGCSKVMLRDVEALTDMCLRGLRDPQAKVRWAACQAIGQMCTDLGPDLQSGQHAKIVPELLRTMEDGDNPRVQAHAAAALVNFSEACEPDHLVPYLDALMQHLIQLLQCGSKVVKEGALTALASVADTAKSAFEKYYDDVMPMLRNILLSASHGEFRVLRAKALECVSLVGMAVGKERFRNDAKDMLQFLNQLHNSQLDSDDPITGYMFQAGARLCKCLGQEFLPYLPIVMPPLLAAARQDPGIKEKSVDDLTAFDSDDEDEGTIFLDDKIITIRTSVLEEMVTACQMLCVYADELKGGFVPYVREVTDIMVRLMKCYYHEEVRRAAGQALPELLEAAVAGVANGAGIDIWFVKEMVEFIWPELMKALADERELDVLASLLESTGKIIEVLDSQLLNQKMVDACFKQLHQIVNAGEMRKKEREEDDKVDEEYENNGRDNSGADDFDDDSLDDEEEEELEVLDEVGSCVGLFLKKFGDTVLPFVEPLMPVTAKLLESRSPDERRIGICILNDLLEFSPAAGEKYASKFLPVLMKGSTDPDADLRQCALFGLGIAAEKLPTVFRQHLNAVLQDIVPVIQHPAARDEENEGATENAVAALGKIFTQFPDLVDGNLISQVWLPALPLVSDLVEARIMHQQLVNLVEVGDQRVLGEGNQNLPRIAQIFVRVLGGGKTLASPECAARIVELVKKMEASVGPDVIKTAVSSLTPKQQSAFWNHTAGNAQED